MFCRECTNPADPIDVLQVIELKKDFLEQAEKTDTWEKQVNLSSHIQCSSKLL